MAANLIYNSIAFPLLFSGFPCLYKSFRKDFLCKVNPADFYEAFSIEVNILKHLLFKDADEIVAELLGILFSLLY